MKRALGGTKVIARWLLPLITTLGVADAVLDADHSLSLRLVALATLFDSEPPP